MDNHAVKIVAVGDVAFNGAYERLLAEHGADYPFRNVCRQWSHAGLRMANLESPISTGPRRTPAKLTLRAAGTTCASLQAAGFDCVSVANNHMMDFGPDGLLETLEQLDAAGIAHVGAGRNLKEAYRPAILGCGDRSVGVLAFCDVEQISDLYATESSPGVAPADLEVCREAVAQLRPQVDWVIVHLHWGVEMCRLPSPLQRRWAEILASAGADAIVGHHPHVLQPIEHVRGAVVAYSLGDFLFSNMFWHGANGAGASFLAHYEVHPLSRRTGWLEIGLSSSQPAASQFRPAYLQNDGQVVEQASRSRRREQQWFYSQLASRRYHACFEREQRAADSRERWRRDGRRLTQRCRINMLKAGWLGRHPVEPDGLAWHSDSRRDSHVSQNAYPAY